MKPILQKKRNPNLLNLSNQKIFTVRFKINTFSLKLGKCIEL